MVIKPFVYQAVGNAIILLLLGVLVPRWWQAQDRYVTTVEQRELSHDGGKKHWIAQPLGEPATWAQAGQLVRAGTIASVILLALGLALARFGGPHLIVAWLAVVATATTLLGAIAFVVLRPELSTTSVGIGLVVTFAGSPLALLGALALARAR